MPGKHAKRRRILFNRDPHCYWCGTLTVWIEPEHSPNRCRNPLPDNAATLDHLDSRLSGERKERPRHAPSRTVLACNKCNLERGRAEEIKLADAKQLSMELGRVKYRRKNGESILENTVGKHDSSETI